MPSNQAILIDLLNHHAVKHGDFTLSSGKKSTFYLDVRQVTLRSDGVSVIAEMIGDILGKDIQAVGGMAIGADPIVGALLAQSDDHWVHRVGFIVRKEAKVHGTGRQVEGPLEAGMVCTIVEDVATTGASALQAADAVIALGCKVSVIIAVVNRLEGAREACAARGIPFYSLVTINDLHLIP